MICLDGRVFRRTRITGVERYAHEIFAALAPMAEIEIIRPRPLNRHLEHIWVHTMLPLEAKRRGATVLWCPVTDAPILLDRKIRLCVTIHDVAYVRHPDMYSLSFRTYYNSVLPWITRRADSIVCISYSERDHIEDCFPHARGKTRVVYQGVSERFRTPTLPKEPLILSVSSLNKHKNLNRLLLAFRSMLDQIPHRLVLIGARSTVVSSDSEAIRLVREMEATGRVISPGYVSDEELAQWYARADIFVLPSLFEGFGFPPLEAMAAGCAVCCSCAPAMPEVCADAAVYFDPYSVEDIALTLLRVVRDDALKAKLRTAGDRRSRQFTWNRAAREMLEILR